VSETWSWLWSIQGVQLLLFDRSSLESSALITCLDLFQCPNPYWFAKILWSWLWIISLSRYWIVLFVGVDLDSGSTSFVLFCWHEPTLRNAVPREVTVTVPWPINRVQSANETYCTFQEKTPGRRRRLWEETIVCLKVFVTNLQFQVDQLTLFFRGFQVVKIKRYFVFGCFVATQPTRQLHQERLQVVCSNKEARKRLAQRHYPSTRCRVLGLAKS